MKAIIFEKYGPPEVLKLTKLERPVPKDDEVLIKLHAATVNAGDCELRRFDLSFLFWLPVRIYMGLFKPRVKVLGQELAGEIVAIGKEVKQFKIGDLVFGPTQMSKGAYVEYVCLPEKIPLIIKPEKINFEEAATITTGGCNALCFLKKGKLKKGDKLLINGAGGCIGTYALQLAKHMGAEVTVVDSGEKLDMLRSIGADYVIDYKKEDFTKDGKKYDVVFDVVDKSHFSNTVKSLNKGGRYLLTSPTILVFLRILWFSFFSNKKVMTALADYKKEDLKYLSGLMEKGIIKALIDKRFPLGKMKGAHQYIEDGHKKGNVVVTF